MVSGRHKAPLDEFATNLARCGKEEHESGQEHFSPYRVFNLLCHALDLQES